MDEKIRAALNEMPEKTRSKLEPHADVIRELRRKGRTYEDIAQFFAERLNLKVAPSTIHAFVRVRARRCNRLRIELPSGEDKSRALHEPGSRDEAEVRRRIDELKRRRESEPERPQFQYDENEPLTLIQELKERRA